MKTWLEYIESREEHLQEALINEAPHTHFIGDVPHALSFLNGQIIDMGFENLGLDAEAQKTIRRAFVDTGVVVPDTQYRLRNARGTHSVIEPVDGAEKAALPLHWKQVVLVFGNNNQWTWIGKLIRQDQIGDVDMSQYHDAGDGWVLQ